MASRIGVMYLGRIVEIAEGRELFSNPRMPYTKMLLGAVPDLAMSGRQRIPVKGEIPNPINPPSGCAFNPRCPLAFDLCRKVTPELIDGVACHAVNNPAVSAVPGFSRRWTDRHLRRSQAYDHDALYLPGFVLLTGFRLRLAGRSASAVDGFCTSAARGAAACLLVHREDRAEPPGRY